MAVLLTPILLICGSCSSQRSLRPENASERQSSQSQQPAQSSQPFDYYLLSLSWAPEFCVTHQSNASASECDPQHHYGFIVHGLWPQNDDGSYPQNCAPARPVAQEIVRRALNIMPNRGLIQHEWAEHGTCSGLDEQSYFSKVEQAFTALHIPVELRAPSEPLRASPAEIEQKFADANHAPASAFRISCSRGDLVAVEVCLTKDLQYRPCGTGMRECRTRTVEMRPVP
jgi:ribonuclease T2